MSIVRIALLVVLAAGTARADEVPKLSAAGDVARLTPWAGLGVSVWQSGAGRLGDHVYEPLRLFPIVAIHAGWEG